MLNIINLEIQIHTAISKNKFATKFGIFRKSFKKRFQIQNLSFKSNLSCIFKFSLHHELTHSASLRLVI